MTTASRRRSSAPGIPTCSQKLEIPRSTAVSWVRRGLGEVVSLDQDDESERALRKRVATLERRIAMLTAVLRLVIALLRVSAFNLELARVPDAAGKRRLLGAIERARAARHLAASGRADVLMDSGVENLSGDVEPLFDGGALQRVIAQIDVSFSNSLIEAWWRSLKHRWLFLHSLDNLATVKRLVACYVTEHNERIPHGAFEGQTPDERTAALVPDDSEGQYRIFVEINPKRL
jgi:hypothetical protein